MRCTAYPRGGLSDGKPLPSNQDAVKSRKLTCVLRERRKTADVVVWGGGGRVQTAEAEFENRRIPSLPLTEMEA